MLFTFTLLLKICYFVHSSFHSPAKMTENSLAAAVLQQNMSAAAFKTKHIMMIESDRDTSVNEDVIYPEIIP